MSSRPPRPYQLQTRAVDENTSQNFFFKKNGLFNNGFYGQDIVMAFSPTEYCRLFAQKKAYQGGVTGNPGPPLATPLQNDSLRTADVFPVVASLPPKNNVVTFRREKSYNRKYVCCSQASRTMDDYRNSPTIKLCADLFPAH